MVVVQRVLISAALSVLLAACAAQKPAPIAKYLDNKQAAVFVFLAPDCPLSQNYTKTLNDLRARFQPERVEFYAVFAGEAPVNDFLSTYQVTLPAVLDRDFRLADFFGATTTPEAFAVDSNGRTAYSGAIDNWAPELGRHRTVITEHYLLDALNSLVQHEPVRVSHTRAVGCFIERNKRS